jgi:hypothetical protein
MKYLRTLSSSVCLKSVNSYNKEAEKQAQLGFSLRAITLQTHFKRIGQLNDVQAQKLVEISEGFQQELDALKNKKDKVIDSLKQQPDNALLETKLDNMYASRGQIWAKYRDLLREAFGFEKFQQFREFLQENFASKIKSNLLEVKKRPRLSSKLTSPSGVMTVYSNSFSTVNYNPNTDVVYGESVSWYDGGNIIYSPGFNSPQDGNCDPEHSYCWNVLVTAFMAEPDGNGPQPESIEGCDGEARVFIYPNSEVEDGEYTVSGEHTGEQNLTSYPYCGIYGGGIDDFSNASVTVQTTPRATIDLIDAVGKDNTAKIDIYVLPTNNSTPITLTLSPSTGTGQAIFTSNNSTTLTITNTTSVEIKGITESSTRDNLRLEAKANNRSLDTEDLTVLSVILSLRFGDNDDISSDNDAKNDHIAATGRSKLGGPFFVTGTGKKVWGHSIEIVGTVLPNNYLGEIILQREVVESALYQGSMLITSLACENNSFPTPCVDTSLINFRDDTISPQGHIFDLDLILRKET